MTAQPRPWFLRDWRKHRGLTQEALAERAGLTKGFVSLLESGARQYTQETLEGLSSALACEPADLIGRRPGDPERLEPIWAQLETRERKQLAGFARVLLGQST